MRVWTQGRHVHTGFGHLVTVTDRQARLHLSHPNFPSCRSKLVTSDHADAEQVRPHLIHPALAGTSTLAPLETGVLQMHAGMPTLDTSDLAAVDKDKFGLDQI